MLSHYLELLVHRRRLLWWMLTAIPLAVLFLSIVMRLIAPIYTAYATVTLAPTKVELDYTSAWSKQNLGSPTEISTQTAVEFLYSTPVLEIALAKIIETVGVPTPPAASNIVVDLLDRVVKAISSTVWRVYYTIDRGKFIEPTEHELLLLLLRKGSLVEPVLGTYLLRISVSYEDPKIAALAANALAYAYVERGTQIATERATRLRDALAAEVTRLTSALNLLDKERPTVVQSRGPAGVEAFDRQVQRAEEDVRAARSRLVAFDLEAGGIKQAFQVIEPAVPPLYPESPRMLIYFLAAIIGAGLAGVVMVVGLDLFGGVVTTSHDLRRLAGNDYLGSLAAAPSLLALLSRKSQSQRGFSASRSHALRAAIAIKGLLDLKNIRVAGISTSQGAQAVVSKLGEALDYVRMVEAADPPTPKVVVAIGPRQCTESVETLPTLTLLSPMSGGFRWSDVIGPDSALVVAVPAGTVTAEEISDIQAQGHSFPDLRLLFCLTDD